jgi:hypothetical protein
VTADGAVSLPPEFVTPPEWTPEQVADFKREWERLTSDPEFGRQVKLLPPGLTSEPVTHIAGPDIQVGCHLRQRCAWCGGILVDYDLTCIAVPEGQDPRPATWAQGDLVRHDGIAWFTVDHEDGADLPGDCCAVAEIDAAKGM